MNLADQIESIISRADANFTSIVGETQQEIFDRIIVLFKQLELDSDGYILNNQSNRSLISKASQEYNRALKNSGYPQGVSDFTNTIETLKQANETYFFSISDLFKPNRAFITSLQNQTIQTIEKLLLNDGLQSQVKQPLLNIISQNINSGGSYSGFLKQLRENIVGEVNQGKLMRYSRGILNDALFQYSRAYQQSVTDDLGLEFYLYSGGTTKDTREFCREHSEEYYHQLEIEAWADEDWQGKIPDTTASSIFTYAGGYNCSHSLIPVDISSVPKDVIQRNIDNGNYVA